MRTHVSRLARKLTYANVMATVAVFLALGGVGYAASKINGKQILKHSIPAGKLKQRTLGSNQVKKDGLTGTVIDESTLSIVPQAQSAASATTATSAKSAETATSAESATKAANAEDSETLEGVTAEELEVSCPATTELFGGMCWEKTVRPTLSWILASKECGEREGRLPTLSELVAYIARPETQFAGEAWASDVVDVDGEAHGLPLAVKEEADGSGKVSALEGASHGFRCLLYRTNS
jgi:hypothetical protein